MGNETSRDKKNQLRLSDLEDGQLAGALSHQLYGLDHPELFSSAYLADFLEAQRLLEERQ